MVEEITTIVTSLGFPSIESFLGALVPCIGNCWSYSSYSNNKTSFRYVSLHLPQCKGKG